MLQPGTKLLACHRRLFDGDQPRFFAGTVECCEHGLAKVTGFTWTRDAARGFLRKDGKRTKIISLLSGTVIVYELPGEVLIEDLRIDQPGGHVISLTDGRKFRMDLAERLSPGSA